MLNSIQFKKYPKLIGKYDPYKKAATSLKALKAQMLMVLVNKSNFIAINVFLLKVQLKISCENYDEFCIVAKSIQKLVLTFVSDF